MSVSESPSDIPDLSTLVKSEEKSQADRLIVDPTLQIRLLQILADKVVESLRKSSEPPPSSN